MFTIKMSNIFITMVMLFQLFYTFLTPAIELPVAAHLMASSVFCFTIPFFIYILTTRQKVSDVLEIKPIALKNILYIIVLSILIQPFTLLISALTSLIVPNSVNSLVADVSSETPPIAMIFIMCIMPAICEEIAIRGAAAQNLKYQGIAGALLNGLYFGIIHLNFHQFPYAFMLGVMLYYVLRITGSIFAPMLAHFTINLSQISLFYLFRQIEPSPPTGLENISAPPLYILTILVGLAFLQVVILTAWAFIKIFKKFAANNSFINIKPAEADNIFDSSFVLMLGTYALLMFLGR